MSRFKLAITVDEYYELVVQAESEEEARRRAETDFQESFREWLRPSIKIEQVEDDAPLGDV